MNRFVIEALGTVWYIRGYEDDFSFDLKSDVVATVLDFQRKYSRFASDSLLTRLNKDGQIQSPPGDLYKMCKFGEELRQLSGGAFNLGVCYVLVKEGYGKDYRSAGENLSNEQLRNPFAVLEPDLIKLNKGMSIDLGAMGKGVLVDKIADQLRAAGLKYFLINAGGDIYATTDHESDITCVLENPHNVEQFIGTIPLSNKAIACSSQNKRYWNSIVSGKRVAHLIDTKTFRPKRGVAAVFTEASNTKTADAVSTALFVSDPLHYERISKSTGTEFAILYDDGRCYRSLGYHGKFN